MTFLEKAQKQLKESRKWAVQREKLEEQKRLESETARKQTAERERLKVENDRIVLKEAIEKNVGGLMGLVGDDVPSHQQAVTFFQNLYARKEVTL